MEVKIMATERELLNNIIAAEATIGMLRDQIISQLKIQQNSMTELAAKGPMECLALVPLLEILIAQENKNQAFSKKNIEQYKDLKTKLETEE